MQGIPVPDLEELAKGEKERERERLRAGGVVAGRARAARAARARLAAESQGRVGMMAGGGNGVGATEKSEEEGGDGVRKGIWDCGWKKGDIFEGLDMDLIAGCAASTLRR